MMILSVFLAGSVAVLASRDLTQCSLQRNGDEKCTNCLTHNQCRDAYGSNWFCCPFMKKCVNSSSMSCYYPIADCRPPCHDSTWPLSSCNCNNRDFPRNWLRGCTDNSPVETPSPAPMPTPAPVASPTSDGGSSTGGICESGSLKGQKIRNTRVQSCADCIKECRTEDNCVGAHFKAAKKSGKKGKCQIFSSIKKEGNKKGFTSWKLLD